MNTVIVIGAGTLADEVCSRLSGFPVIRRPDFGEELPEARLALVVEEEEGAPLRDEALEKLEPLGIPWLCAYISMGEGIIGPLHRPGRVGCPQCAETRRSLAGSNRQEAEESLMRLVSPDYVPGYADAVSLPGLGYMAGMIAEEAAKVLRGDRPNTDNGYMYLIQLRDLSASLHYILPDSACPVCGRLPDDTPEAAQIRLQPSLKVGDSFRCRAKNELREVLFKEYWDRRTGMFNDKGDDLVSAFAGVAVNLPLGYHDEVTGGRSLTYADSGLAAILEGLERFCGMTARGKRTVVSGSYSRLREDAMDPFKVGLHAQEHYDEPDFPFTPFDPEAEIDWVWGYSFAQQRPILVPELLAYYSLGFGGGFVYETSNGSAVGGSLEEAILYGIFEVVERDSFLMTWYARMPVPRLDYRSSGDRELTMMIQRLEAVTGYRVQLFNTTTENGIPSLWALAKGEAAQGANLVCAAGAHLDPVRAAKSAIFELAGTIPMVEMRRKERGAEAEAMAGDALLVEQMEDHALLYSLPQVEERLRFLLDEARPVHTFAQSFPAAAAHQDLTDDLRQTLQTFHSLQMDVIAIDQSSGETLRNGLYCAKVLIPGMLPMTFGHRLRRLAGMDRLLEVPARLGYAPRRLTPQELNPDPHPFP